MPFVATTVSREEEKIVKDALTEEEIKRCNKNAIAAILTLGQKQAAIKRLDVNKLIKTGQRYHKVNHALITFASHDLYKTLGLRLFEFDDKFILVNSSIDYSKFLTHKPEGKEELVILFFTLIAIFASSEEKCSERGLVTALRGLDIKEQDLVKTFSTLVKKAYLTKRHEQDEQMYAWGPRAVAETDPANFFDCFLELAEGKEDDWPEQKRRIEILQKIHATNNRVASSSQR